MGTQKRCDRYYSRVRIPADLRQHINRSELVKSLQTTRYRVAKVRAARWESHVSDLFVQRGEPCYRSSDGQIRTFCKRKPGERCYRSTDGRFQICNIWSADNVRDPHWLLIDHVTDHRYRFFVRVQAERKIEELFAQAGSTDTRTP